MGFKKTIDLKYKKRIANCFKERIHPTFHPVPNTIFRINGFRNISDDLRGHIKNMGKVMRFYNKCLDLDKDSALPKYLVVFMGHTAALDRLIGSKDRLFVLKQIDNNPSLSKNERSYIKKVLAKLHNKLENIDGIVFVGETFSDYTNISEYANHYIKIIKAIENSLHKEQEPPYM